MTNGRQEWYKSMIDVFMGSEYRRDKEYGSYLHRYFDENNGSVDGMDYTRRMREEPMPYNVYFDG